MASETYSFANKAWKSACRVILGAEVGELEEYEQWLSERADPVLKSRSELSGKPVNYSYADYCKGGKWISFDEIDFARKFTPLSINEIKDIDSLAASISDRFLYTGNVVLGNSKYVEGSSNVSDSFYVYGSSEIGNSKYIAYTSMARLCEYVFGSAAPGESGYMISCNDTYRDKRCLELWMSTDCSDCYYVFAVTNCMDCFFCFSLRAAKYAIGNTVLPKDKYLQVKSSLLEQMRDELVRNKRLPSLMELVGKSPDSLDEARAILKGKLPPQQKEQTSMAPIEKAFSFTSKAILGTELSGLAKYEKWLTRHIKPCEKRKSVFSGVDVFVGHYAKYSEVPKERTVLENEALRLAELSPPQTGIEKITLQNAHEFIGKIAYMTLDYHAYSNKNIIDCMAYALSSNAFRCYPCVEIKDSAYNFWPRSSEHCFGCGVVFDSAFCIHCYQSVRLNRCFEVDSSKGCSECLYSHNIENCSNCLFCFNVKNMRYAVGNVEVGREQFMRAREMLLKYAVPKLLGEKDLALDIFNLGCQRKK